MSKSIAFALTLAGLLSASEAKAQHKLLRGTSPGGYATTTARGGTVSAYPSTSYASYAEYNTFTFYGHYYGRPYAPWTWPYMSGSYGRGLARYYDPPVK
jgi:hypothetical protein